MKSSRHQNNGASKSLVWYEKWKSQKKNPSFRTLFPNQKIVFLCLVFLPPLFFVWSFSDSFTCCFLEMFFFWFSQFSFFFFSFPIFFLVFHFFNLLPLFSFFIFLFFYFLFFLFFFFFSIFLTFFQLLGAASVIGFYCLYNYLHIERLPGYVKKDNKDFVCGKELRVRVINLDGGLPLQQELFEE